MLWLEHNGRRVVEGTGHRRCYSGAHATEDAVLKARITREGVMAREYASDSLTRVLLDCVLGTMIKGSEAGILAGNPSRFSGKRLGTDSWEGVVFSHAVRRATRRRERRALAVKAGILGSESRKPCRVSDKEWR